jgi:hypothetical protein
VGGPIAIVQDGDMITIDATNNTLSMNVSDEEIQERLKVWKKPRSNVTRGVLAKYQRLVGDASHGKSLLPPPEDPLLITMCRCDDGFILDVYKCQNQSSHPTHDYLISWPKHQFVKRDCAIYYLEHLDQANSLFPRPQLSIQRVSTT